MEDPTKLKLIKVFCLYSALKKVLDSAHAQNFWTDMEKTIFFVNSEIQELRFGGRKNM